MDVRIATIAGRQHGVLARSQLVDLGLNRNAIQYRLAVGRLHRIHRGVYSVGHELTTQSGRCLAAVLACGPRALLSHRPAAWLWALGSDERLRVEVTAPRFAARGVAIQCHVGAVPEDERTVRSGIPVTTVPRTLLDLAASLRPHRLRRAIEQAEVLRLTDELSLHDLLARYPRRRGSAKLRDILADGRIGATITRSELEERFFEFVADAGLPRPEVNARLEVGGDWIEVDCVWRAARLAVELDGHATHATLAGFERDRARDRRLQAAGWRPVRITWRQLHRSPTSVEADLRALLVRTTT